MTPKLSVEPVNGFGTSEGTAQDRQRQQEQQQPRLSQFEIWLADLEKNPDQPEIWRRLCDMAEVSGDEPKIRLAYDALLKQYPNTVRIRSNTNISQKTPPFHLKLNVN